MAPVTRLGRGSNSCARCNQIGRACASCTQRRRVAWRLVDQQGQTIKQAAATLNTPPARIRALVDQERDRRELEKYRLDSIPRHASSRLPRARARARAGLTRMPLKITSLHQHIVTQPDRSLPVCPAQRGRFRAQAIVRSSGSASAPIR